MTLGEKLKYTRKNKALTQKVIAELLGVAINTYSQYENDLRKPSIKMLNILSNFYKTDSSYFVSGESMQMNNTVSAEEIDEDDPGFIRQIESEHNDSLKIYQLAYDFRIFLYKKNVMEKSIEIYTNQYKSNDDLDRIEAVAYLEHAESVYTDLVKDSEMFSKKIKLDRFKTIVNKAIQKNNQ